MRAGRGQRDVDGRLGRLVRQAEDDIAVQADEGGDDTAADERRERPLAGHRRAGTGHEQPHGAARRIVRRRERRHDDHRDLRAGAAVRPLPATRTRLQGRERA